MNVAPREGRENGLNGDEFVAMFRLQTLPQFASSGLWQFARLTRHDLLAQMKRSPLDYIYAFLARIQSRVENVLTNFLRP